ncbi:protein DsrB [Enterobacter asburiae]|nr:protein DsrB [Enterobacter asburiae]NMD66288.1 protein DsrB [Enterobacter sp. DNRA5]NQF30502.1 protein DsrB [Enterobacter asburiae]RUN95556.1 protein DsrB [Enterobacter asburiae]
MDIHLDFALDGVAVLFIGLHYGVPHSTVSNVKYRLCIKTPITSGGDVRFCVLFYTGSKPEEECMKVNDRVTVKTDGGPRRPGVVLAIEEFSEGTMYLVSLEDYPLGIWFFNELGHPDGIFVEKAE